METKVNKEYQKLIDDLELAVASLIGVDNDGIIDNLKNVIARLKILGARPVLSDNVEQFMSITQDMTKTYAAKNHDYGNSFEQSLDEFGLVASIVRIGDKMNRIKSLIKKEAQVKDESIKDTLLDLASYSVMTLMWLTKQQK